MEVSGAGKSPNAALSFRYNANNEELEELSVNLAETEVSTQSEILPEVLNASPKKGDKTPSILDKYFKSMRSEKPNETPVETKLEDKSTIKDVTSSPMKEYLNRFNKKSNQEPKVDGSPDTKEGLNETWKLFQGFKTKLTQAVEDIKSKSQEEAREKSVPRDNSTSDSEENSAVKDTDQQSVGDTDNQVSSLDSSMQNLSDVTQPPTAKATEREQSLPYDNKNSDSSDDTHKNLVNSPSADLIADIFVDQLEIESGVEAFEDNVDLGQKSPDLPDVNQEHPIETPNLTSQNAQHVLMSCSAGFPSSRSNIIPKSPSDTVVTETKTYFLSYTMYVLSFLMLTSYLVCRDCYLWNGFLIGLWSYCLMSSTKEWVVDKYFSDEPAKKFAFGQTKKIGSLTSAYVIPTVKEHTPLKKYECWVNHYRYQEYDPCNYHISNTTTAFLKLEGCNLRISYTRTKVAKRALWDEKIENVVFYQHRLFNMTGAKVMLLPKGLAKRRQWSKKYPICLVLSDREKIQVLEKEPAVERPSVDASPDKKNKEQSTEVMTDANTSPEKKRKFVWRRREKSVSRSEVEPSREGLRHRLARKMHRDKKADSPASERDPLVPPADKPGEEVFHEAQAELAASASAGKDTDEEMDEHELTKIKDFLEEAEPDYPEASTETEWSVRTKHSKDTRLYLFARTGRDKHELYRRLMVAIADAKTSDCSTADDKSGSEPSDNKDAANSYKLTEKDTVTFVKSKSDSLSEGVTISAAQIQADSESYEKTFWPYLMKIIQSRPPNACSCKVLPAEMTWVNTVIARFMFDAMRNDELRGKLQNRIQRKLHTMKLPSFMSPLMVTSLSLSGACPQLEWIAAPAWDERGVWLDADLKYEGGAYISILTQINLMKLKQKNVTLEDHLLNVGSTVEENIEVETTHQTSSSINFSDSNLRLMKPAIYDSDEEDSAESSSDEEAAPQPAASVETLAHSDPPQRQANTLEGTSSKKRFLRIVDKIATNKYFQTVTDYKYVKKAMEGLSHTDIKLQLEVQLLEGRLAVNLPPPPHDRLWIGFRTNPQLVLKARPAVGTRTLRFGHISNWIETKLSKEFEKVLVLPNMEDFIVDLMAPTPVEVE